MATMLKLDPGPDGGPIPTRPGATALRAVRRGLLARAAEHRRLRLETIPALWPMTRHLVRRIGEQLVQEGLLERGAHDVVRITDAGRRALDAERDG